MIHSYLLTAMRHMLRNKLYTSINLLGLSIGIGCCLLLTLYVQHEFSYDQHHARAGDLYRINTIIGNSDEQSVMRTCSPPVAMTMMEEVAGVAAASRVLDPPQASQSLIKFNNDVHYESNGLIADSTVFQLFTYEFIEGNQRTSLTQPNSVVISDKMATRLFGAAPAVDKIISITQGGTPNDFRITGVFREQPLSHIHANFFTSINSTGWAEYLSSPEMTSEWVGSNFVPSYVLLNPGENAEAVATQMNKVLMKYGAEALRQRGRQKSFQLEPVKDIYLRSEVGQSPRITYVYSVLSIGIFILLIACINFMNLSTARAARRSAEIGIRKVMGAFRLSLIRQIMAESMAFVVVSALMGVGLAWIFLPSFNELTGKLIRFDDISGIRIIAALLVIVLVTGLLAGSYPSFYLSSFQPAQVLKGKSVSSGKSWLRQSLVVFQFFIAIILICGSIVISRQMNFIRNAPLGFESKAKLVLPMRTEQSKQAYQNLKKVLSHESNVHGISATAFTPGYRILFDGGVYTAQSDVANAVPHGFNPVDAGYIELLGIRLLTGTTLVVDEANPDNYRKVVINETSAKQLGFTIESAVGQIVYSGVNDNKTSYHVVGVMEDFHQTDLHEKISPVMFYVPTSDNYDFIVLDVAASNIQSTINSIEDNWTSVVTDTPFEFTFLDESLQRQYDADSKTAILINTFSAIAIFISCLGLYALSAFMAERRYREIGIRKVMGASVSQVIVLMSSEYVRLIFVALVLSIPFAYFLLSQWLETFAYRVSVTYSVFIYAGVSALMIALFTVCFETSKAALTNPVKSLKSDV